MAGWHWQQPSGHAVWTPGCLCVVGKEEGGPREWLHFLDPAGSERSHRVTLPSPRGSANALDLWLNLHLAG